MKPFSPSCLIQATHFCICCCHCSGGAPAGRPPRNRYVNSLMICLLNFDYVLRRLAVNRFLFPPSQFLNVRVAVGRTLFFRAVRRRWLDAAIAVVSSSAKSLDRLKSQTLRGDNASFGCYINGRLCD